MKNWNERGLADLMRSFHDASQILEEKCDGDLSKLSKVDKWSFEFTNMLLAYSDVCCALGDLFKIDPMEIVFE